MEAELKPKVVEIFDSIADNYKKLSKLQDVNLDGKAATGTLTPARSAATGLKDDTDQGGEVAFSSTTTASRRWSSSSTTSTATWCRWKAGCCVWPKAMVLIARVFENPPGFELDANWMRRVANLAGQGLEGFRQVRKNTVKEIRGEIQRAGHAGNRPDVVSSAASCTRCRRASARPRSPRRRWSRPICAW
jgi:RNA polymerase primary sigma factor